MIQAVVYILALAAVFTMAESTAATDLNSNGQIPTPENTQDIGVPLRLFIAGDRSKVGKSSVCLGILGALLDMGYSKEDIAYIKPATQCEKPQLVQRWCEHEGVPFVQTGPVVFYKGFTRAFLRGEAGTSEELLAQIENSVASLEKGKKIILIDGVGYPAVGSICGISNADIAAYLCSPVLIVGRPGVGDAVDSFNLHRTFFLAKDVPVLGAVFNRLLNEGYYSIENCKKAVDAYFAKQQQQEEDCADLAPPKFQPARVYGYLPLIKAVETASASAGGCGSGGDSCQLPKKEALLPPNLAEAARLLGSEVSTRVDLQALLQDARQAAHIMLSNVSTRRPITVSNKRSRAEIEAQSYADEGVDKASKSLKGDSQETTLKSV